MSDRILDEWERTVGADDLMLCLGDVAHPFGLVDPRLAARLRDAPGRRLPVLGNHDVDPVSQVRPLEVDRVTVTLAATGDPPLLWTHVPPLQTIAEPRACGRRGRNPEAAPRRLPKENTGRARKRPAKTAREGVHATRDT